MFQRVDTPVALDSAGKYGAGLALEVIGECLQELGIPSEDVVISNKLGWARVPLTAPEPTFEPGAWVDLDHDAEQDISYQGILRCWEQGCELLGEKYTPQMLSVHDPDEYLAQATSEDDKKKRTNDILEAYRALSELKQQGQIKAIGVGSKDWQSIKAIHQEIQLDWVMLANSLTLYSHPVELLDFVEELSQQQIGIINSAVFNAGFLTGGDYFNYRKLDPHNDADKPLFQWRETFLTLCRQYSVLPANACVQFGMSPPGVMSVALNTSKPQRIQQNVTSVSAEIPKEFWAALKTSGLLEQDYPHVG
jgi:D-threo-aldose 1-dehydrogenase